MEVHLAKYKSCFLKPSDHLQKSSLCLWQFQILLLPLKGCIAVGVNEDMGVVPLRPLRNSFAMFPKLYSTQLVRGIGV